jgi:hypothetical protein
MKKRISIAVIFFIHAIVSATLGVVAIFSPDFALELNDLIEGGE